ncbi:MAG TPA: TIGR02281 family clan AA aspartic protease [Stellaceae bacterium]|jgi:aspartyl protease family protein|nr:TIGR02281 family clan AA aspartic protease [Stellaceae bacterium]
MISWALRVLAIWGVVGLLVYAFIGERLATLTSPSLVVATPAVATPAVATPAAATPGDARTAPPNSLAYRADRRGHVVLEGAVNGAPIKFLVDTGATLVALTLDDAANAGISHSDLVFNSSVSTANGIARVARIKLRELRVGQFTVSDVPAVVVEHTNISLLGQSFLSRLDSYEMRDGVLTLNWN